MALTIPTAPGPAIDLPTLVAAIEEQGFDPRDEAGLADLAPLLAGLSRDRAFLARLAADELKRRCAAQEAGNGYGAQVFLLRAPHGGFALRANFWPAADDPIGRESGSDAFFYDHAHDHNFSFLTVGYLGPGYRSDHYERAPDCPGRLPGDAVRLTALGRSALGEGEVMLYRRHRDVHVQLPPERFSVSLNILTHAPDQAWHDQYRFDIARGCIAEPLTTTPSQALLATAVGLGCGNARDIAEDFARTHPSPRMRMAAIDALAGRRDRDRYGAALADPDRYVVETARSRLAALEPTGPIRR